MILHLSVEAQRGPIGRAGRVYLAAWLSWDAPGRPWRSTVLERRQDDSLLARDVAVPPEAIDLLYQRLQDAGFGSRPVRVREVVDTSDDGGKLQMRALLSTPPGTPPRWAELEVPMLSSGFDGEDADALRTALTGLLDILNVASKDARWAATGA